LSCQWPPPTCSTYLILKEKVARFNAYQEIQTLLAEINAIVGSMDQFFSKYSFKKATALKAQFFDRSVISFKGLQYERLDQLTIGLLLGTC
jgi:xylose isomerase